MKKQKLIKTLGLVVLLMFATTAFGQVYKLKATSSSYRYITNQNTWSEWSELSESGVLISIDLNNDRITIYSTTHQVYDIATYEGKTIDKDGDVIFSYFCIDKNGLTCRVQTMTRHSQNGKMQMYVYYDDMNWGYNINFIE